MATMQGAPGRNYQALSGRRYEADEAGLIQDVADNDIIDLLRSGCDKLPTGQNPPSSPRVRSKNRGGAPRSPAWNKVIIELLRISELDGLLTTARPDLQRRMVRFCLTLEGGPDASAIRGLLQELYDEEWMRNK